MQTVFLCREGFESTLAEELNYRVPDAELLSPGPQIVLLKGPQPPQQPAVFERDRIAFTRFFGAADIKPVSNQCCQAALDMLSQQGSTSWDLDIYPVDSRLVKRAGGFRKAMIRMLKQASPTLPSTSVDPETLLRVFYLDEGIFIGSVKVQDLLESEPGGVYRMKHDPGAPSRSYLKLEEVFYRWGTAPSGGETAVDLGAAPGGWTYAMLKRGCRVTAVDHGRLKLPAPPGKSWPVKHLRENGMTYEPSQTPVDWLVGDMLIPPGPALGLCRKWIGEKWARRFVMNIKLPQKNPWESLLPVETFLRDQKLGEWTLRQLFHDRKEVTLWGSTL